MIKILDELNHTARKVRTLAEAKEWILSQAFTVNGRRIYRYWQEADASYWDVGNVYHIIGVKPDFSPMDKN